jgi:hypothetical protein
MLKKKFGVFPSLPSNLRCIREDEELMVSPPKKLVIEDGEGDNDYSQYSSPSFEKGEIKELLHELSFESSSEGITSDGAAPQ